MKKDRESAVRVRHMPYTKPTSSIPNTTAPPFCPNDLKYHLVLSWLASSTVFVVQVTSGTNEAVLHSRVLTMNLRPYWLGITLSVPWGFSLPLLQKKRYIKKWFSDPKQCHSCHLKLPSNIFSPLCSSCPLIKSQKMFSLTL